MDCNINVVDYVFGVCFVFSIVGKHKNVHCPWPSIDNSCCAFMDRVPLNKNVCGA